MEVALALFAGEEIDKDEMAGCVWLEAAAKGGLAEAQFELGSRHVLLAKTSKTSQSAETPRLVWNEEVCAAHVEASEWLLYHDKAIAAASIYMRFSLPCRYACDCTGPKEHGLLEPSIIADSRLHATTRLVWSTCVRPHSNDT
jgi:hypothetical protein